MDGGESAGGDGCGGHQADRDDLSEHGDALMILSGASANASKENERLCFFDFEETTKNTA
jgi:hypothetical protein